MKLIRMLTTTDTHRKGEEVWILDDKEADALCDGIQAEPIEDERTAATRDAAAQQASEQPEQPTAAPADEHTLTDTARPSGLLGRKF